MPLPQYPYPVEFQIKAPKPLQTVVKGTLTTLFHNIRFGMGRKIYIISKDSNAGIFTSVRLEDSEFNWEYLDQEINSPYYHREERQRRVKERIRLGIMLTICREYRLAFSPWGILIGVRPTKMVHRLIDEGFDNIKIRRLLSQVYNVSPVRQDLLMKVVLKQRDFFLPNVNNPVSIYIGIPFCPTRCSYCSFAAYPLKTHSHFMSGFLQALIKEIIELGGLIQELGIKVQSVYIGGGTPTTLDAANLDKVLFLLNKYFSANKCQEYTIEAGRPETITLEKLKVFKSRGIHRICINPQTMNDKTLKLIGRRHTSADIRRAFDLTRKAHIPLINSDLILGLPGETVEDFEHSLNELVKLNPDNITVHGLALKRASALRQSVVELDLRQDLGEKMWIIAQDSMKNLGFEPYYLYRQRFTLSDLENIGYGKPGTESIYNIQMMEERQTIIGLGGGAITKLVSHDLSLVRQANPKCPATYINQIEDIILAKKRQIENHLAV